VSRMIVLGRILFGVAMVGFGVIGLVFVEFVHNLQPVRAFVPTSTPGYGVMAILNSVFLIAAGLAIMANIRTQSATIALAVWLASWIVLLQVPSAFVNPRLLRSPWWIRMFELVVFTGAAMILAARASEPVRERWVRVGRIMFGVSLPVFGVLHLVYPDSVARLVPPMFPWPMFWAYFTGSANLAAGIAIVAGVLPRLAAYSAAAMYGTYALTLHIPRQFMDHPPGYQPGGATSTFIAIGFCGAALIVAGSMARTARAAMTGEAQSEQRSVIAGN
jgi:uncharacterized membrane protein YphA (DoxX/SURF4 family)